MGYYYLKFYTAESRPGEGHLMEIQEFIILPILVSRPIKQGKIVQKLCLVASYFLLPFVMPKLK